MTDPETTTKRKSSIWTELGPAIAFVLVYNILLRLPAETGLLSKETALYWATGVLIVITLVVVGLKLIRREKIPPMLLVSSAIIGGFGTLGIVFQNKVILFIKPTVINLLFSSLIIGGLATGRNIIKTLMGSSLTLPDRAWHILAIRWAVFFIAMAVLNEYIWRNYSEATWANWKLGYIPITFAFVFANMPFIMKHMPDDESEETNET
ncbi:MAG: inner membrane-spanning protein YciB [Hyphomonadaceae bacterium]